MGQKNIYGNLKVYPTPWQVKSEIALDAEDKAMFSSAKVVSSDFGKSVCFFLKTGGQQYIPLCSKGLQPNVGDNVNLDNIYIQVLQREGEKDIMRIKICSTEEKDKIEEERWKDCKNIKDYKRYILVFPEGSHIEEAKETLERFENEMFLSCKSVEDCKRYLNEFPEGKYIMKVDDLFYGLCKKESDFQFYLKSSPKGEHLLEAKDELAYLKCRSKWDFRNYMKKFPNGKHLSDAKDKILGINGSVSVYSGIISFILLCIFNSHTTGVHLSEMESLLAFVILFVVLFYAINFILKIR